MTEVAFPGTPDLERQIDSAIHSAVFDAALPLAEADIIVIIPFLGWPVINSVFHFVLGKLTAALFARFSTALALGWIQITTDAQLGAYEQARSELKAQLQTGGALDAQAAIDKFKATLGDLIHFPIPGN